MGALRQGAGARHHHVRRYLGARYNGEIFGTRDGGNTWEAMPLPGQVKDIYAVACG
jgi:hypothetical protein